MKRKHTRALKRLRNVIRSLREAPEYLREKGVPVKHLLMRRFFHPCGSPACVLGHYAFRTDLQKLLLPSRGSRPPRFRDPDRAGGNIYAYVNEEYLAEYFCLKLEEMDEIFASYGCDQALTRKEAIEYIEKFIERKEKEWGGGYKSSVDPDDTYHDYQGVS